jgi:hypothetical protein
VNQTPLHLVNFHSVMYSDFDFGENSLLVLRVHGLVIVNGSLNPNGLLEKPFQTNFDNDMPQLVLLPYTSSNHEKVRNA